MDAELAVQDNRKYEPCTDWFLLVAQKFRDFRHGGFVGGIAWRQERLGLVENKNLVFVEAAHFSYDGTVTLKLSDKRELKLAAEIWAGLGQLKDIALTDVQQELLEKEACYTKIRNKTLSFLATREHSAFELRRKLQQRFYKSAAFDASALVERCLLEMQEHDFQSDERFTIRFVESKLANNPNGPYKILQDLQNRGISREMSEKILHKLANQELWLQKALKCLERLHKKGKEQTPAVLNQKLYQRGFSWGTIELALAEYQNFIKNMESGDFKTQPETFTTENP
jgi:regulatory protein